MNMHNKHKKYDKLLIGFTLGIIAPLIVIFIVFLVRFNGRIPIQDFISKLYKINILPALLSLCAIANLGIFFLYYKFWYNNAARGVIMATFLYAFIVLLLKIDSL